MTVVCTQLCTLMDTCTVLVGPRPTSCTHVDKIKYGIKSLLQPFTPSSITQYQHRNNLRYRTSKLLIPRRPLLANPFSLKSRADCVANETPMPFEHALETTSQSMPRASSSRRHADCARNVMVVARGLRISISMNCTTSILTPIKSTTSTTRVALN